MTSTSPIITAMPAGLHRIDTTRQDPLAEELRAALLKNVVGQDEGVNALVKTVRDFQIGIRKGPMGSESIAGSLLFLGPTGSGKSHIMRALAQALHQDPNRFIKLAGETFEGHHEVSKLIGPPPSFLGFGTANGLLTQKYIDSHASRHSDLTLLLIDEIEKAHKDLFELFLGIMEDGALHLSNNTVTSFNKVLIVITSNLGAKQIDTALQPTIGFQSATARDPAFESIKESALLAARKFFSPEFWARLDHKVVFRPLNRDSLRQMIAVELALFNRTHDFEVICTEAAREMIIDRGLKDRREGARAVKRALHDHVLSPVGRAVSTNQVDAGDEITVDLANESLVFARRAMLQPNLFTRAAAS